MGVRQALCSGPGAQGNLILDEPAGGLDEANRIHLNKALQQLSAKRTTFVITHDLRFSVEADRTLHLVDGHLFEGEAA